MTADIQFIKIKGTHRDIADSARTTIGLDAGNGEVSSLWMKRMFLAEHSPIRKLIVSWKWFNLKYWISVHFVRHKFGIEHWVSSQRPDRGRTGNRDDEPQSALVEHECEANAQAIINISRKRLCFQAMPETRSAWIKVLDELQPYEPELVSVCVPDCIYRGFCYEYKTCGYFDTKPYHEKLYEYRKGIRNE